MGSSPYMSDEEDSMEEIAESMTEYDSDGEEAEEEELEVDHGNDYGINAYETYEHSPGNAKENIVPTSVVDLKEIASLNAAIALLHHLNIPKAIADFNRWVFSALERVLSDKLSSSVTQLLVPTSVREQIAKHFDKMQNEIKDWVVYHYRQVFFNGKSDKSVYYHIYDLVWYCNGTINYKETARKLLNSLRLSQVEKYYLLCTYCLEDDMKHLSRELFTNANNVVDRVDSGTHPLIYYWNCYFRNELDKLKIGNTSMSIDCYMIKCRFVDNWPAKEYFFNHLCSDEQVQMAIWLIDKNGIKYLKLLLMKLNESQRLHLYMERPVKIMTIFAHTGLHYDDILLTWFEIRNLITSSQFVLIFKQILGLPNYIILNDVWTSACEEFKRYLLTGPDQYEVIENALRLWVSDEDNDFFFTLIQDADVNLKINFSKKRYFLYVCEKLISEDQLKLLDRLLNSYFSDDQELALFKQYLTNEDFFGICCLRLITRDELLPMLERLYSSYFPNPEESARFRRDLTQKEFFNNHCRKLMNENEFSKLERLFNECLPDIQELMKFKQDFMKNDFFIEHCAKLITNNLCPMLDRLLHVFFPQVEDSVQFKQELTSKEFFIKHCEKLIFSDQLEKLDELLNSLLPDMEEILKFKRDFALNSTRIRSRCLEYYGNGSFKLINALLNRFLSLYPELILEYKKNLILSPEGLARSVELFEKRPDLLNRPTNWFIPDDLAVEIKKIVIFSHSVTPTLQSWIREGRVGLLKDRINQFLTTDVDKRVLKRQVFGNPLDFILDFFFNHEPPVWQLLMLWWLENEGAVQEYKHTIPVDEIFDAILKKCVFEVYDTSNLRYCKFKSNLEFVALDRFLIWYFETPRQIKEYKLKIIDSYMFIDTIRTLLKKTNTSYLKKVISWFFEEDNAEISTFKMKNRGRRILKYFEVV